MLSVSHTIRWAGGVQEVLDEASRIAVCRGRSVMDVDDLKEAFRKLKEPPCPTDFKSGDLVQLKSGGPAMTVVLVKPNDYIETAWMDNHGVAHQETFPKAALKGY